MTISLIVAHDLNRGIGKKNKLLWKLPRDMNHFRETTMGHWVVMGRKTADSIGKPLKGRKNAIISRQPAWIFNSSITVANTPKKILDYAKRNPGEEIFIIGGSEIYRQFLPYADKLYVTEVQAELEADAHFPIIDSSVWEKTFEEKAPADAENIYDLAFLQYQRVDSRQA